MYTKSIVFIDFAFNPFTLFNVREMLLLEVFCSIGLD